MPWHAVGHQQRRKTLGAVVTGNLKAMRMEAFAVLAKARLGVDVVAGANAATKVDRELEDAPTLGTLVSDYFRDRNERGQELRKLKAKSLIETSRYLEGTKRTPSVWADIADVPLQHITKHPGWRCQRQGQRHGRSGTGGFVGASSSGQSCCPTLMPTRPTILPPTRSMKSANAS